MDINLEYPSTCPELPFVEFAMLVAVSGDRNGELGIISGPKVEYRCERGYRNSNSPTCEPTVLRCSGGTWDGKLPNCVPVKDCPPPPAIANGHILGRISRSPFGTEVIYQCLPGFELRGKSLLTCSRGGCWEPLLHPTCHQLIDEYMNTSGTLLVSIATASGVMLILLAVCLVIVCRRRKPWGRQQLSQAVGTAVPHHPTVSTGDSTAALIHDPDRLALIAFADGLQAGEQSVLPSYEEATRERTATTGGANGSGVGLLGYRPHRPHWSALSTARRGRPPGANQQAGDIHVTRQSSCTSHSASMRSGSAGDPMGSTDTMTPSEVSTNVTLDTVSSHSGSQPASCRAICGSLASFDTSSVHNTEGVPLLEENEAEETPTTETIADNASFKYRRASPDLA